MIKGVTIMNYKNMTVAELIETQKNIENEIDDLYKCLELMPKKTFLGVMSLKATIKKKIKKLNNITLELSSRNTTK